MIRKIIIVMLTLAAAGVAFSVVLSFQRSPSFSLEWKIAEPYDPQDTYYRYEWVLRSEGMRCT